jgi:hypothetical protein
MATGWENHDSAPNWHAVRHVLKTDAMCGPHCMDTIADYRYKLPRVQQHCIHGEQVESDDRERGDDAQWAKFEEWLAELESDVGQPTIKTEYLARVFAVAAAGLWRLWRSGSRFTNLNRPHNSNVHPATIDILIPLTTCWRCFPEIC